MTKDQLRKFIKDTRGLVRGASPEKKIKLLSLIKEATKKISEMENNQIQTESVTITNTDYLDEK